MPPFVLRPARAVPALLAASALLAACSGDATGPSSGGNDALTLSIQPAATSLPGLEGKQLSLAPNDTARVSGVLRTAAGATQSAAVTWTATNAAVATVDPQGLIRAVAIGSGAVVASANGRADTLRVVVSNCGATRPLDLAVGQVQAFDAGQGTSLCVTGGAASQDYVLVPYYASDTAGANGTVNARLFAQLAVTATGVGAPSALADLSLAEAPAASVSGGPLRSRVATVRLDPGDPEVTDAPLRARLRAVTRRDLLPRLSRGALSALDAGAFATRTVGGPSFAAAGADVGTVAQIPQGVPKVGDLLRVNARADAACDTTTSGFRIGRVVAVSERLVVVADTANPTGGFSDDEYRGFAAAFDTLAYPVDVANFGTPGDIDSNGGRAVAFFTRSVNDLTPRGADYVIGGYFWERDLFPNNQPRSRSNCIGSNAAELFYMLVPDPNGQSNGNRRSKAYVASVTVGTLGHEFQHLINASRRLYTTNADDFEVTWLNEGLSHVAEELIFYRAAGLAPRGRITGTTLGGAKANAAFNDYGTDNLRRLLAYLRAPESRSAFGDDDDLETRGATWQFLRYAADRLAAAGRSEPAFWKALVDNPKYGMANLKNVLGTANPSDDWFRDWAVANAADGAVSGLDARFTNPSWDYRSVIGGYSDQRGRPYALATRALTDGATTALSLNGGSAAYLRFTVPAGRQATVRTAVTATPRANSAVRLSVVRVR